MFVAVKKWIKVCTVVKTEFNFLNQLILILLLN